MTDQLNTKTRKLSLELRCKLSKTEFDVYARRSADAVNQLDEIEAEAKNVAKEYKAKKDKLGAEIREIATKISSGHEMRAVDCEEISDFERARITVRRLDTGDQVSERVMTNAERQKGLDLGE